MSTPTLSKAARPLRRSPILVLNTVAPTSPVLKYQTVADLVERRKPLEPVHIVRPHAVRVAAKWFLSNFPGQVMYAVKTNPEPRVLRLLAKSGIRHFDVASLAEVQLIAREVPKAKMYFMHPVKSREAIMKAYHEYGVKTFSLDSLDELQKIAEMTHHAKDLSLFVRLANSSDHAAMSLKGKFGVSCEEAKELLVATRQVAAKVGICFHVGSQCMNPQAYRDAIASVRKLIDETGVSIDVLDIGGGFPSIYPEMMPPALQGYMDTIRTALTDYGFDKGVEVFCEPGRALVAEAGSILVRVELRKGNALYINDGIYGALFDAGIPGFAYPARAFRPMETLTGESAEFSFFGPTCDSLDAMKGPFRLPADIKEGDWIEIGGLGAYGQTMRTKFNGFYSDRQADVSDSPMLSLFGLN